MKILSIDSSRNTQSFSVYDFDSSSFLLSEKFSSKSSLFLPEMVAILNQQNLSAQDFQKLAVVTGPGSFTGIRTALSIVKTLAAELNLEIFAVNNFQLLRFEQHHDGALAMEAGLNDYYISLDEDYDNSTTNFFSLDLQNLPLLNFKAENISRLTIDFLKSQKAPIYLDYKTLKPYYLREPSVGAVIASLS